MTEEKRPPSRPAARAGSEYGDVLSDVLADQAQRSERRERGGAQPVRRKLNPVVAPSLAVVSFWFWIFPPGVLQPTPPPEVPAAVQEAGLRIEMYLQLARIQKFVKDNGRLPISLRETEEDVNVLAGVEYVPLADATFRLRGRVGGVTIDYVSTEPVTELLKDAKDVVTTQAAGG